MKLMEFVVGSFRSGDTIVEVILAVTIFSMVAVGAIAVMNRGVSIAQRSLEITLVRSEMKAQAEGLRFIHQQYIDGSPEAGAQWTKLLDDKRQAEPSNYGGLDESGRCPSATDLINPYALNIERISNPDSFMTDNIKIAGSGGDSTLPYANFDTNGAIPASYGLWIESVQKSPSQNFVDFHIRACWDTVGQAMPITRGTIVRLYVPN